jgi:hypothetical protein
MAEKLGPRDGKSVRGGVQDASARVKEVAETELKPRIEREVRPKLQDAARKLKKALGGR